MRAYRKNDFTREDFMRIESLLSDESISEEYRKAVLSLVKAYVKDLYCSDCQASSRTSSTSGVCTWNNDMAVFLPLNDGPLESYPAHCPIRKLLK